MKILVFSTKEYEVPFLERANVKHISLNYTKDALDKQTAIQATGFQAISIFSGDDASSLVLEKLWDMGVRYISLRSAGYNNIRIKTAKRLGFKVANTPNYSPHAIAEHAVALLLAFNRNLISAVKDVHEYNFSQHNLMGHNLHGKTVGVVGTGKVGSVMVKIMHGFGCKILACDLEPDDDLIELCQVKYTTLEGICSTCDIISLHIPLTYDNYYLINKATLALMKPNVILINTARGAIVKTEDLIESLEEGHIGGYCADVYEKEKGVFFRDNSKEGIADVQLKKLLTFKNVLLTPHQAFMTHEALKNIANTTFENLDCWAQGGEAKNELGLELLTT